jgi:phage terminase small subunit
LGSVMTGDAPQQRNVNRHGRRRLTEAEVAQRDQHAAADHRRLYGRPLPVNDAPMPAPPSWFTADQRAIWRQTLATAPAGLLRAADAHNLAVLCGAIDLHQRLARELAQSAEIPEPDRIQQLRLVGAEVGRASRVLGLNPPERARIGLPVTKENDKADAWAPFPTVIDGDKAA